MFYVTHPWNGGNQTCETVYTGLVVFYLVLGTGLGVLQSSTKVGKKSYYSCFADKEQKIF
jgi:hypothetical protein